MKFNIENLGVLESARIEIADLTVICGENNTGKTYITYLIYCLLTRWRQLVDIDLKDEFSELKKNGVTKINLQEKIANSWDEICQATLVKFKAELPEMLASKAELFAALDINLELLLGTAWQEREFKQDLRSPDGHLLVTMIKPAHSVELELAVPFQVEKMRKWSAVALGDFIESRIFNMMLEEVLPNVFIASTERTGAVTFKKQLNLATSNIMDLLSQVHRDGADSITPNNVFETLYGNPEYAIPVRHNVRFVNQLPSPSTEEGELFKDHPDLLRRFETIVGGAYMTNKEGVTYFQPKGTQLKLGLGQVSSSVRSLLIVWYWLKYFAKKGDMLMLDEPELNLHPVNQRRLARFLVALVNNGIKVFITTHSDYIVREFNTLIMLNQASEKILPLLDKFKDYTPEDKLDYQRVGLYMTEDGYVLRANSKRKTKIKTLIKADISPTLGIEAKSFDKTIDDMNAVQEAIYYAFN